MSSDLVRLGGLAAMVDGMLWIATDFGGLLSPNDWDCSSSYDVGRAILPRWVSAA